MVFVAIPLVLTILDLAERRRMRCGEGGEGPPLGTLLFLLVVFLVYSAFQYGGLALVPQVELLAEQVGGFLSRWLRRPLTDQPMDSMSAGILVVFLFYVGGLWDYLLHRFVSHSRWLWFTHEYHHLPSQIVVFMPGISARPFAVFSTLPVVAANLLTTHVLLVLLGFPAGDLIPLQVLLIVQVFVLTASHSSCLRRWWLVHRVLKCLAITTPQEHVLHHTVDLRGNFGNFTTLWDRLFGTYLDPAHPENQGHACGLPYDQDFLGALTLGVVKISDRLRHRFQVGRYCNLRAPESSVARGPHACDMPLFADHSGHSCEAVRHATNPFTPFFPVTDDAKR
jgi:sterol desaturase/sphingolipid hydroxylase (fatty acid hydroxylase superfamily)